MKRTADQLAEGLELHAARTKGAARAPIQVGWQSPFTDQSALQSVVWADVSGATASIMDRDTAMSIPAMARQRHLLVGTGARCPLRVLAGPDVLPTQPTWPTRTDGEVSPYHRMLWTLDDLLFHGWSLWSAVRGVSPEGVDGALLRADRIDWNRWTVDPDDGLILVDEQVAKASEVILIPGPHEGVLNFGRAALRRTLDNQESAARAARNPSAYLELHYVGDDQLTDEQIDKHIERWAKARRGDNGGVAWTNKWVEVKEHGTHQEHLLIEGRNADSVDVSRLVSSPATMADATTSGASLTYETSEGRNIQFLDYGVSLYMDAVAARLSMDDVVPRGQRVAFDTEALTVTAPAPTGAVTPD
jgi:hypothetical protein